MWQRIKHWALLDPPHSLIGELKPWGPRRKRALRFWSVLVTLLFLSHLLAKFWVFEYAGVWSADALARLRTPQNAEKTAIVAITAKQRKELLGSISPIPAVNLLQAVCAVLRAQPKVLGVDLDTSYTRLTPPHTATKIVWARGIQISRQPGEDQITVNQDYLLGQSNPANVLSGLAVAPVMLDWSVRNIPACHEYAEGRVMQTMTTALASAASLQIADCSGKEKKIEVGTYRIHYRYDRFTLGDFTPQTLDKAALGRCQRGEGEWAESAVSNHPLKDRVVLLGGEYDAQDWHPTPYGLKPGVEVQASLTEHLLRGSVGHEIEDWIEWGSKFVLAMAIAWIHCRFRPVAALVVCLLGLGALVLTGGLLAVYWTAYRAATVPFLLGIVLEQLVTSAEKAQEVGAHALGHSAATVGAGVAGSGHP